MARGFGTQAIGLFIIAVGVVLLLNAVGVNVRVGSVLGFMFAALVIVVGLALLRRSRRPVRPTFQDRFFGDLRVTEGWTGADATYQVGVGELVLDLTRAQPSEGERAIEVNVVVGRAEVIAPKDLALAVDAEVTVGAARLPGQETGGFMRRLTYTSAGYATAARKVRLNADVTVGELVVRQEG